MKYARSERLAVSKATVALALAYRVEYDALLAAYHAGGKDDPTFPFPTIAATGCRAWVAAQVIADATEECLIEDAAGAGRKP